MAKEEVDSDSLVRRAVNRGLEELAKKHNFDISTLDYLYEHIDNRKLNERIRAITSYLAKNSDGITNEQKANFLYKNIESYVARGKILDEAAKEVVLKKSISKEDDIDRASEGFKEVYKILKHSDYAERLPQLAEAVGTIYDLGFLETTLRVLKSRNTLSFGQYYTINKAIKQRKAEAVERATNTMNNYIVDAKERHEIYKIQEEQKNEERKTRQERLRKVAAVLFFFGTALVLLSSAGITGNAIRTEIANGASGILGVTLIFASLVFLMKHKKMIK